MEGKVDEFLTIQTQSFIRLSSHLFFFSFLRKLKVGKINTISLHSLRLPAHVLSKAASVSFRFLLTLQMQISKLLSFFLPLFVNITVIPREYLFANSSLRLILYPLPTLRKISGRKPQTRVAKTLQGEP